jgi:hypothetical protein
MKPVNTLYGQNTELLIVKAGSTVCSLLKLNAGITS